MEMIKNVSMDFIFQDKDNGKIDSLIFVKKDCVFTLNFKEEKTDVLYKFKEPLNRQPLFFNCNQNQNFLVIANKTECIHVDVEKKKETDLDELYAV